MPWNQPGNGSNGSDPWGQRNRGGGSGGSGPPDLDDIQRQARKRVEGMLSRRGGGSGAGDNGESPPAGRGGGAGSRRLLGIVLVAGLVLWGLTGIYTVDQGERAVELRFGRYSEINDAGLNWHIPRPIETVEIVNTQNVNTVEVGYRKGGRIIQSVPREALMLTQDENIIDVQFAVQYDVKDATDLLFNVSEYNPRELAHDVVRQATESAVREIVGRNTMDFVITEGRAQIAAETKSLVQAILDRYETGINIRAVEMQNAQPPEQVKDAFDDVVKAREDEERLKNLAEAYANDIIPRARGFAARILQEAEAYKASVTARADGETARFDQIRDEYSKAPEVTRDRLYLETMERVFQGTSKMVIDQPEGGNNVMYLPLDQLVRGQSGQASARGADGGAASGGSVTDPADGGVSRFSGRNVDRSTRQQQ